MTELVKVTALRSVGEIRMGSNPIPDKKAHLCASEDGRVVKAKVLRSFRAICVGSIPTPRKKARQRAKVNIE